MAEVYQDPGCKIAGTALDAAYEKARRLKKSTSGIKVRLVSREEIELRHEREDREWELEEAKEQDPRFMGLGSGDGNSNSRSLGGS